MLDFNYEDKFRSDSGYRIICGVDEAGRGPLAGPVVAAVCILEPGTASAIEGLNDSKVISPKKRERIYNIITSSSISWCSAQAVVDEIDSINILNATMLAMNRAIFGLALTNETFEHFIMRDRMIEDYMTFKSSSHTEILNQSYVRSGLLARGGSSISFGDGVPVMPELALIDGNTKKNITIDAIPVIKGDTLVPSIAAASIIAKVTRDRMCIDMHNKFPEYGFDRHKGYPTREHMMKIINYGPSPYHRKSFLSFLDNLDKYQHYLGID